MDIFFDSHSLLFCSSIVAGEPPAPVCPISSSVTVKTTVTTTQMRRTVSQRAAVPGDSAVASTALVDSAPLELTSAMERMTAGTMLMKSAVRR